MIARGLIVASIALMVGYVHLLEFRGPYWQVGPIECWAIGELDVKVWVESTPGEGSTFSFSLRAA